jgi:hypothetical protein
MTAARLSAVRSVQPLDNNARSSGQWDAAQAVTDAAANSPAPDDLQQFEQVMGTMAKLRAQAPQRVAAPGSDPLNLHGLSGYLSKRGEKFASLHDDKIKYRSPESILEVMKQMSDSSFENELLAKVVGKTISGIDQLTKLN